MSKTVLICFPYAGGSANIYYHLKLFLSKDIEIVTMDLPGRGVRFSEKVLTSIDEMAEEALLLISKYQANNYALFGYSMGGILAYEVYYKLIQNRIKLPKHIFIAACDHVGARRKHRGIKYFSDTEFIDYLREINGTPEEVLENQELLEIILPSIRGDFEALDNYQYKPRNLLINCDVSVLAGTKDSISRESLLMWGQYVTNECSYQFFNGDHFFIRDFYKDIADVINKSLLVKSIV